MPYLPHVYAAFGGQLNEIGNLDEIWQCGVRLGAGDVTQGHVTEAQLDTYIEEIHAPLRAWWVNIDNAMSNQANLGWLKVNNIDANGHYSSGTTHEYLFSPPPTGPDSQQSAPAFCSVAYSWRTDVMRGIAAHGRIYPPNFAIRLDRGSEISQAAYSNAPDSAHALLAILRNAGGTVQMTPIVASKSGVNRRIVRVGVGNVYDYLSRRKNGNPESYHFIPYP